MAIDKDIRQSLRFKLGRAGFCSIMFSVLWVRPVAILLCLMIVSAVLASLYDVRYFIVSLRIVFIVCPMVVAYMYYHYGLGKYCYFNVTDHSLTIEDDGVAIDMCLSVKDETKAGEEGEADGMSTESGEKHIEMFIDYSLMRVYYVGRKGVYFPIGEKKVEGFLWIPENAYPNTDIYIKAIDKISQHVKKL